VLIADELCGQVWPSRRGSTRGERPFARAGWVASSSFGKQVYVSGLRVWSEDTTGGGKFLFQDHLGSTRITGDASGTLFDDIDYLPLGDIYNNYGSTASDIHYLFTVDEYDSESSTNYAVNRNLSGSMARFNRPDPYDGSYDSSNPQSFNRYVYTANNPMTSIDPFGLDDTAPAAPCIPVADGNARTGAHPMTPVYCTQTVTVTANPDPGVTYCDSSCIDFYGLIGPPPPAQILKLNAIITAPNNGTPWYKNPCVQSALAKGAASTAIDAVGLLPEGGAVAGAFSLFHGAAGVSNGINILSRVQFGAAIISTASAGSDASGDGAFSLAGAQLATGFASIGAGLAKATPIVGQVLSGISVAEDLYGTYKAVAGCHP
jgi:RHS repeat-associated protein